MAHGHRRQGDALGLEVFHHRREAAVDLAQALAVGDTAVVEVQLGGVGAEPAGLLKSAPDREARRAFFYRKHGDGVARGASARGHEVEVSVHAVGDEELAAMDDPAIAIAPRCAAHARHVRARAGLSDGHGRDGLAAGDARHPARQLLRRAGVVKVRCGHVGVHEHGDDEAAKRALRQRLGEHQVGHRVRAATAMLGRKHQAEQAGLAHAAQHLARHAAGVFPGQRMGLDFARDEARHLLAQQLVFGLVVDGGHGCRSMAPDAQAAQVFKSVEVAVAMQERIVLFDAPRRQ